MARKSSKKSRECSFEFNDELTVRLGNLQRGAYSILKASLYPGAGVLADEIKKACPDPTLANALSIVKMDQDGGRVSTAVVFAGYDASHVTKQFPKGVPWPLMAAIYESGTSDRYTKKNLARGQIGKKYGFIRKAVNAARARSNTAMQDEMDKQINRIMEDK